MRPVLLLLALAAGCRQPADPVESTGAQDAYRQPDRLVRALGLRPGSTVAEIGAGGGYLTLRLARLVGPGGRVVATDIDPEALAALGDRVRRAGLGAIVEARHVRPAAPGLDPGRHDLILLAQVDHLLLDRVAYLRALLPALRPGGRIAISNAERHREGTLRAVAEAGIRATEAQIGLPAQFLLLGWPAAP